MKKNLNSKKNPAMTISKIILIILTLIFPILMNCLAGIGLLVNSNSYGQKLTIIGIFLIISGIFMTVSTILCILKKNIISIIFSVIGFSICMSMLYLLVRHADSSGWTNPHTLTPISDMYLSRILPNIANFILCTTLSTIQFFSYECSEKRRLKKQIKYNKLNANTPSIID